MVVASALRKGRYVASALALALACSGCASTAPRKAATSSAQLARQADAAYTAGRLQDARAGYQALVEQHPREADLWFRLGNVYVRTQQPDQAADAYQHALVLAPDHAKAWHNLGIVRLRQAEAAFVQSASQAGADQPLQQASRQLADDLAHAGAADAAP